jgi:hypothetical protein
MVFGDPTCFCFGIVFRVGRSRLESRPLKHALIPTARSVSIRSFFKKNRAGGKKGGASGDYKEGAANVVQWESE